MACLLERAFRQYTGKRVEGVWGRVWTWVVLLSVSWPLVGYCNLYGWAGLAREVHREYKELCPVWWVLNALGVEMVEI
jgi:hypothetical protein